MGLYSIFEICGNDHGMWIFFKTEFRLLYISETSTIVILSNERGAWAAGSSGVITHWLSGDSRSSQIWLWVEEVEESILGMTPGKNRTRVVKLKRWPKGELEDLARLWHPNFIRTKNKPLRGLSRIIHSHALDVNEQPGCWTRFAAVCFTIESDSDSCENVVHPSRRSQHFNHRPTNIPQIMTDFAASIAEESGSSFRREHGLPKKTLGNTYLIGS